MSTESEPTGITPGEGDTVPPPQEAPGPPDMSEPPPPQDTPEPAPAPEPPPAPNLPDEPLVFEPATWYSIENVCLTQDMGGGKPCPHLNKVSTDPMVYSNAGEPVIVCWPCGERRVFLAATKLDPQPEMT
ncbi:MAG TPA: hypothetical protein VFY14_14005 [Streptomyces sp.]|nr:hypothetical protein [Streptomyces sp.]